MRLWIDTGHLNSDSGAVGGGKVEVERNDDLADAVEVAARRQGWKVGSTNENDRHTELRERYEAANRFGADAAISIHHDWVRGEQAVIFARNHDTIASRRLSTYINSQIDPLAKTTSQIYADRRGLAFLRGTKMPTALIEAARVQDPYSTPAMAEAIVRGIAKFFGRRYIAPGGKPVVHTAPVKRPTLKVGSRGGWVKTLQSKLNRRGARITVDGIFGEEETLRAVRKFQRDNGLEIDGVVGPKTWAKLYGEVN